MEQQTVIFLGPQGSGKGTQVELFKKFLQEKDPNRPILHLEMGAELRRFNSEGDAANHTRALVRASMLRGEFQPAFISSYVMAKFFIDHFKDNEHFVVDGFPREIKQAVIFDTAMDFYKRSARVVLNIMVPEEESVKRLLGRGRTDDTEAGIRERLEWNRAQVMPMIDAYRSNSAYKVVDIDGVGTVEDIHLTILQKLELQ